MQSNCDITKWHDRYLIGHDQVDLEHKKLFKYANEIILNNGDMEKAYDSLKKLIKYTRYHFANEELYMKSINYKGLSEHKLLHAKIVDDLDLFIKNMFELTHDEIITKLKQFVVDSLIGHILTEDKRVHHSIKDDLTLKKVFQWKDTYNLNNETIDEEHKKLFEIAIKALTIDDSFTKKEKRKRIKAIIVELYKYMKLHFEHEDELMKKINYPDYDIHKEKHHTIIKQMNKFIKKLPEYGLNKFKRKLIEYIDIWLVNHILNDDKKIMCYLEHNKEIKY